MMCPRPRSSACRRAQRRIPARWRGCSTRWRRRTPSPSPSESTSTWSASGRWPRGRRARHALARLDVQSPAPAPAAGPARRDACAAPHRKRGSQTMTHGGGPGTTIASRCRGEGQAAGAHTTGPSDLRPPSRSVRCSDDATMQPWVRFSDGLTGDTLQTQCNTRCRRSVTNCSPRRPISPPKVEHRS